MLYLQIASPKSSVLNVLDSTSFEVIISIFQRTEKVPDMERLRFLNYQCLITRLSADAPTAQEKLPTLMVYSLCRQNHRIPIIVLTQDSFSRKILSITITMQAVIANMIHGRHNVSTKKSQRFVIATTIPATNWCSR